jgi:tetratricopeptide (TPR) repeat protein
MKGRYHIKYGEYNEGVSIVKEMTRYALFYKDYKNALIGYKLMIYYCIQILDEVNMAEYIEKSLEIAEIHSLSEEEGTIFRFKGLLNIFTGNYNDAEYFLKQSIHVFEMLNLASNKYTLSIAAAYNYLGDIKRHNKRFKEAIEYYDKAIEMCDNAKIISGITTFCKNAGQAAYEIGDYQKSLICLERAAKVSEKLDSIWGRPTINAYFSLVLVNIGRYNEGLIYLKKADIDLNILKTPYEVGVLCRVKAEIKKNMETNTKLRKLFDEYLCDSIETYCRKGIEVLSPLKGTYEIDYMKALL